MTLQTAASDRHVDTTLPVAAPTPTAQPREPLTAELPHRTGEHGPNLATLDQLRTGGRNALLSPQHRRRAKPRGCTSC